MGNIYVADTNNNRIQKFGVLTKGEGLVMKGPPVSKKAIATSAPAADIVEKKDISGVKNYTASPVQKSGPAVAARLHLMSQASGRAASALSTT